MPGASCAAHGIGVLVELHKIRRWKLLESQNLRKPLEDFGFPVYNGNRKNKSGFHRKEDAYGAAGTDRRGGDRAVF